MATRAAPDAESLRLVGRPRKLVLSSPALADSDRYELELPKELKPYAADDKIELRVRKRRFGFDHVRLRLAQAAPPGHYTATLRAGDKAIPISVDIAPSRRLHLFPTSAEFEGAPKASVEIALTVTNGGNVSIDIPERAVAGIYDDDGLETAFADTYRQETNDPLQLLGHWVTKLREGHGGLLKLHIAEGAGALEPGTRRTLTIKTNLPEILKPGHSYHGIWQLDPAQFRVNVKVTR